MCIEPNSYLISIWLWFQTTMHSPRKQNLKIKSRLGMKQLVFILLKRKLCPVLSVTIHRLCKHSSFSSSLLSLIAYLCQPNNFSVFRRATCLYTIIHGAGKHKNLETHLLFLFSFSCLWYFVS